MKENNESKVQCIFDLLFFYNQIKALSGENIHIDGTYPIDNYNSTYELLLRKDSNICICIRKMSILLNKE